eukprot:884137-Rhodomonas_salina.2
MSAEAPAAGASGAQPRGAADPSSRTRSVGVDVQKGIRSLATGGRRDGLCARVHWHPPPDAQAVSLVVMKLLQLSFSCFLLVFAEAFEPSHRTAQGHG